MMTLIRVQSPKPLKSAFDTLISPRLRVNDLGAFVLQLFLFCQEKR